MSSMRLALKQSMQEAGITPPSGRGDQKKRRKKSITKRGARPGEPPKMKRKRGRPRKHPRPEDLLQGGEGDTGGPSAASQRDEDDHGDSSSENEFSYDEESGEEEEDDSNEDESGEEEEESGEEDDDDDDDDMGSDGEKAAPHDAHHKATSSGFTSHDRSSSADSHNQLKSSSTAVAGHATNDPSADASTPHDEFRKQQKLMKKKLKHSAANKIQSQWKKKKSPEGSSDTTTGPSKSTEDGAAAKSADLSNSTVDRKESASPSHASGDKDAAHKDDGELQAVKKKKKRNGVVPPPTPDVLEWAKNMPELYARKHAALGMRVKVRFATKVKREGKYVKKKIWYGGRVAAVSKKGSKIKIKYDDGTSEIAKFPDKDVVVDSVDNGEHEVPADKFLPSDDYEMETEDQVDDSNIKQESKPVAEEPRSSPKHQSVEPGEFSAGKPSTVEIKEPPMPDTAEDTAAKPPPSTPVKLPVSDATAPAASSAPPQPIRPQPAASPEEGELSPGITSLPRKEVIDVLPMKSMPSPQKEETEAAEEPASKPETESAVASVTNPKADEVPDATTAAAEATIEIPKDTSDTGMAPPMETPVVEKEVKSIDDILVDTPVAQDTLKRKRDDADAAEDEPPSSRLKVIEVAAAVALPVVGEPMEIESAPEEAAAKPAETSDSAPVDEKKAADEKTESSTAIGTPQLPATEEVTEMDLAPPQQSEKKKKKKDRSKSPRPRSPKPAPNVPSDAVEGQKAEGVEVTADKKMKKMRELDNLATDLKEPTQDNLPHNDSFGSFSRGERKAAQDAKDKINTKEKSKEAEQAKKKKKKRKLEEGDGEKGETVEDLSKEYNWVQCDACSKWRAIPGSIKEEALPRLWYCRMNTYDPKRMVCEAPEQTEKQVQKEIRRAKKRAKRLELEAQQAAEAKKEKQEVADAVLSSPKPNKGVKSGGKVKDQGDKKKGVSTISEEKRPPSDSASDALKEEKKKGKKGKHQEPVEAPEPAEPAPEPKKPGRKRGRPARNQSAPQPSRNSQEDEDNVEWVQCENPNCQKWRKLPPDISADELPDKWYCSMNTWNPAVASCDAAEDKTDAHHHEVGNSEWQLRQTHAGKYSYRQMIFGTGARKQNRPMSERARCAESLFVKPVSDDDEHPVPTTQYSKCSSFLPRTSNFHKAHVCDETKIGLFDVLGNSTLFAKLRAMEHARPIATVSSADFSSPFPKFVTYESLPREIKTGMQEAILQILGNVAMAGDTVVARAQQHPWEQQHLINYCNTDVVINTLLSLVRDGIVEMTTTPARHIPISQWIPLYRRKKSKRALEAEEQIKASKCMKIAKPWKQRAENDTDWTSGREAFS